jgi:NAD(P)-dependent dehydrogenase (short-subunit alcohol dehydrogenase family)
MSLVSMLKGKGPSGFGYGSTTDEVTAGLNLEGKTYLVTGCNSGLGLETTRILLARGGRVIALARTADKAREAGAGGNVLPYACELSEPASVRAAVQAIQADGHTIDAMILNAGIMALPTRTLQHGQELQFLTNHFGHFILGTGLLSRLTKDGRVVVLSSAAHQTAPRGGICFDDLTLEKNYNNWTSYGQSKLANLLFARELARRLPTGQVANAVHPGVISTNLGRHMGSFLNGAMNLVGGLFLKTIPQGAATQVWAATHPSTATLTGQYLADCNVAKSSAHGQDMDMAARLWARTEEIVAKL